MALTVTHPFVSSKADSADTTLVRPTNWNANHTVSGTLAASDVTGLATVATSGLSDDLTLTDNTTNNASTSKHGFLLKLDNNSAHFMNGQGAWATPSAASLPDFYWFGDGADGNVTVSSGTTTLTRDMYYNNLTITGGSIETSGYRIFVLGTLDITAAPASSITRAAAAGSNAVGTALGAAGVAPANTGNCGSQSGTAGAGVNGAAAAGTSGGNNGSSGAGTLGGIAGIGGAGGNGTSGSGGSSGTVSTSFQTGSIHRPMVILQGPQNAGNGAPGGGSGAGDGTAGGGSGGGGVGGLGIQVYAKTISRGGSTAAGCIQATGGTGGNGGNPAAGSRGGGGAGGGGGGPYIYILYSTLTGSQATNAVKAIGGTGGNGGTKTGTGTDGTGGTGGNAGRIILVDVTNFTLTETDGTATTGTGPTGTTGGAGATAQSNL